MLYFSRGSFGFNFDLAVCPDAMAIDASETSKIDRLFGDMVENLMRCEVVGAIEVIKRTRLMIPDSSSRIAALARFPNPEEQSCRELSPLNC
jgi:hypothetical protein